jgi:hypothetical protein
MTGSHLVKPTIQAFALSTAKHLHKILGESIHGIGRWTGLANGSEGFLLFLIQMDRVTHKQPHCFLCRPLLDRGRWNRLCTLRLAPCGSRTFPKLSQEAIDASGTSFVSDAV